VGVANPVLKRRHRLADGIETGSVAAQLGAFLT
jgi:hypothetical protein